MYLCHRGFANMNVVGSAAYLKIDNHYGHFTCRVYFLCNTDFIGNSACLWPQDRFTRLCFLLLLSKQSIRFRVMSAFALHHSTVGAISVGPPMWITTSLKGTSVLKSPSGTTWYFLFVQDGHQTPTATLHGILRCSSLGTLYCS